jgi:hypothetical protein
MTGFFADDDMTRCGWLCCYFAAADAVLVARETRAEPNPVHKIFAGVATPTANASRSAHASSPTCEYKLCVKYMTPTVI